MISGLLYSYFQYQKRRRDTLRIQELNELKSRFYTNITHEFRTPISIILGMANRIQDDQKQWLESGLEMIHRNGQQLLTLVNQMLDLSKLEANNMNLQLIQHDILQFLRYHLESYHALANSQDISVHFLTELDELVMDFDPESVKNILSNLLSNAIKYNVVGGDVTVHIEKQDNHLKIKVIDTGIGISDDQLPYIFDRFYQVENNLTRSGEGTGIGPSINPGNRKITWRHHSCKK